MAVKILVAQQSVKRVITGLRKINTQIEKAASSAVRDAAKKARTAVIREVGSESSFKQTAIKRRVGRVIAPKPSRRGIFAVFGVGVALPPHVGELKGITASRRSGVRSRYVSQSWPKGFRLITRYGKWFVERKRRGRRGLETIRMPIDQFIRPAWQHVKNSNLVQETFEKRFKSKLEFGVFRKFR